MLQRGNIGRAGDKSKNTSERLTTGSALKKQKIRALRAFVAVGFWKDRFASLGDQELKGRVCISHYGNHQQRQRTSQIFAFFWTPRPHGRKCQGIHPHYSHLFNY